MDEKATAGQPKLDEAVDLVLVPTTKRLGSKLPVNVQNTNVRVNPWNTDCEEKVLDIRAVIFRSAAKHINVCFKRRSTCKQQTSVFCSCLKF